MPIDCGYDTYFNAAPSTGSWLANYWNLAGYENPFLIVPATPKAKILDPANVKVTTALLLGEVNAEGLETTYQFEYGKTTSYGTKVPVEGKAIGSEASAVVVEESVRGLAAETTYHFRVVGENAAGTTHGQDETFTAPKDVDSPTALWHLDGELTPEEEPVYVNANSGHFALEWSYSGGSTVLVRCEQAPSGWGELRNQGEDGLGSAWPWILTRARATCSCAWEKPRSCPFPFARTASR